MHYQYQHSKMDCFHIINANTCYRQYHADKIELFHIINTLSESIQRRMMLAQCHRTVNENTCYVHYKTL